MKIIVFTHSYSTTYWSKTTLLYYVLCSAFPIHTEAYTRLFPNCSSHFSFPLTSGCNTIATYSRVRKMSFFSVATNAESNS
jgi:hypothetical protein